MKTNKKKDIIQKTFYITFIVVAFSIFTFKCLASVIPGVSFGSIITPGDTNNIFAVTASNYIQGGYHQVPTLGDRNAIPPDRRDVGMLVYVVDAGSGTPKTYRLISNPTDLLTTDSNWGEASWVDLSSDQTINGIKTFTLSPIVPTPTLGTDAANKQYVDDWIATGISWKTPVATFTDIATTYPAPSNGWAVLTLDDNKGYVYNATDMAWVQFNATQVYTAGDGLSLSGLNVFSVNIDTDSFQFNTGKLALKTISGLPPGSYGDASNIPVLTVDSFGRVTSASTVPVAGGGGGGVTSVGSGAGLTGLITTSGSLSIDTTSISSCTDSITSKLIWSSTNNRLDCATDQGGGGGGGGISINGSSPSTYSDIEFDGAGVSVSGNTVTIAGGGGGGMPAGTNHGDIAYYNGSNWTTLVPGTSGQFLKTLGTGFAPMWDTVVDGGGTTWIPLGVTASTVGGIASGTNLGTSAIDIQTTLRSMFYPYVAPSTTLALVPAAGLREVGDNIASVDLSSTTTKHTNNITTFTFSKTGSGVIFTDPTPASGGGSESYTDGTGVSTETTYTATVGDGTSTGTAPASYTFAPVYYYGVGAKALDLSTDGGGLSKILQANTATVTESFSPSSQVYYFAYPQSYPALTSILDKNGFETITDYTVHNSVSITNSHSILTAYRVYEGNNLTTQTNFNNTFKQ